MESIEHRLLKLEKRVNRYRNLAVVMGILLGTVVTLGAVGGKSISDGVISDQVSPRVSPVTSDFKRMPADGIPLAALPEPPRAGKTTLQVSSLVQTKRLEIVNSDGQPALILAVSPAGEGLIFVQNSNGNTLCYIGVSVNGNGLIMLNSKEGKNLVAMGSDTDTHDGYVNIRNRDEKRLISLFADGNEGGLWLNNSEDRNLFFAGGSSLGNGQLAIKNKSGKRLISMFASENTGNLWINNTDDKMVVFLGTDVNGQGKLSLRSSTGTELITAGSNTDDEGLLRISNSQGNLEFVVVAGQSAGFLALGNSQENNIAIIRSNANGGGQINTYSPQGIRTWSTDFGQTFPGAGGASKVGDLDGDGDIDPADFLIFSENFGK